MKQILQFLAGLVLVSCILHLAWERLHMQLYTAYEALEGTLPVYLYATLGDVMYSLVAFAALSILRGGRAFQPGRIEYALLALFGLAIALFVEQKAHMLNRWEYTEAMPLIYGFGLSPLLQMTILLPLSVYIVVRALRWFNSAI